MDVFWYFLFVMLILVPVIVIWIGCVIDVVARPNMNGLLKALWVVGMLVFPIVGCIAYLITKPKEVVVTDPGLYDSIYATGAGSIRTSTTDGPDAIRRSYY